MERIKPITNPEVILREEFEDWSLLINPDTSDSVGINPVGIAAWKLMDGKSDIEEIVIFIKQNFDEVSESVESEILAFIEDLKQRGFIKYKLMDTEDQN
jgi:SynChlorMet cassette protein ScmD